MWQRYWIQVPRFPTWVGNFGNRKAFTAVLGHVSLRMRRIGIIYASCPNSVIILSFSVTSISINWRKLCRFEIILAKFLLSMRRNSYFCTSGYNMTTPLDTATPISYKRECFSNWSTRSVLFWHLLTRNPQYFYFRSAWPNFLKSGTLVTLSRWIPYTNLKLIRPSVTEIWRLCLQHVALPNYIVTLTIDLLTLNGCRKFSVMRTNPPPTLSILRLTTLKLQCSHSDCY